MAFRAHGRPAGFIRLLQPFLRRTLERQFAEACKTLKRLLESGLPAAPGSGEM